MPGKAGRKFCRKSLTGCMRQPGAGLVCWFGELLTEKFNPGEGETIDVPVWKRTYDLVGDRLPILALEILDDLEDVFAGDSLNLPALLRRYTDYLRRLSAKGLEPLEGPAPES